MSKKEKFYTIKLKNINTYKIELHRIKCKSQFLQNSFDLTYNSIIRLIQQYNPQNDKDYVTVMHKSKGLWIFMTDDFSLNLQSFLKSGANEGLLKSQQKLSIKYKYQELSENEQDNQKINIIKNIEQLQQKNLQIQSQIQSIKKTIDPKCFLNLQISIFLNDDVDKLHFNNIKEVAQEAFLSQKNIIINVQKFTQLSLHKKNRIKSDIIYLVNPQIFKLKNDGTQINQQQNKQIDFTPLFGSEKQHQVDLLIINTALKQKYVEMFSSKAKNIIVFRNLKKKHHQLGSFFSRIFFKQLFETSSIRFAFQQSFQRAKDQFDEEINKSIETRFENNQKTELFCIQKGNLKFECDEDCYQFFKLILTEQGKL